MRFKLGLFRRTRRVSAPLLAALLMTVPGVRVLRGQSSPASTNPQSNSPQSDNPFPDAPQDTPEKAPEQKASPQEDRKQNPAAASPAGGLKGNAKPAGSENPFPGEESNAPIIPDGPGAESSAPSNGNRSSDADKPQGGDTDGDPVRSPDESGSMTADDGFSSSRSSIGNSPDENEADAVPGKSAKIKTRAERISEDLDVGRLYLDKRNWKGAQDRFASAFKLDAENEDALWGLAEAERHLDVLDKAREHYELFLSYDPSGPHSKAARKALDQVEAAQAKGSGGKVESEHGSQPR